MGKEDGAWSGAEVTDLSTEEIGAFSGCQRCALGAGAAAAAAEAMKPGAVAAFIAYENAWAVPFVAVARDAGGQVPPRARRSPRRT
ncbi:MAG TPA: hypothetical protein VFZ70_15330 [Euzebyales bacterium]